jgi:hypothetical protein
MYFDALECAGGCWSVVTVYGYGGVVGESDSPRLSCVAVNVPEIGS